MESIEHRPPAVLVEKNKDCLDLAATRLIPTACSMHFHTHNLIGKAVARSGYSIEDFLILSTWEKAREILSLRHGAYRMVLDGESYRDPKPMPERSKPPAGKGGKPTQA